jgi:hypothetical protein
MPCELNERAECKACETEFARMSKTFGKRTASVAAPEEVQP